MLHAVNGARLWYVLHGLVQASQTLKWPYVLCAAHVISSPAFVEHVPNQVCAACGARIGPALQNEYDAHGARWVWYPGVPYSRLGKIPLKKWNAMQRNTSTCFITVLKHQDSIVSWSCGVRFCNRIQNATAWTSPLTRYSVTALIRI